MTKFILSLLLCLTIYNLNSQSIGIDNNTPDPSSILDIYAKDKGVLIPRMSTLNRLGIITPAEGLMVYDTDEKSFYFYQSGWKKVGTTEAIADLDGDTEITVEDTPDNDVVKIKANGKTILTLSRNGQDDYLIEAGAINTFFGHQAGAHNEALQTGKGTNNTFIGVSAGQQNTGGFDNTFVGHEAGRENDTGQNNTYIGKGAGQANQTGSNNVYIGHEAGSSLTSGDNQLILANNDITTPLVYGEFDNAILRVNGELQVGYEYAFPLTDGSSSQIMKTDGIGNVSWSADQVDDADADPTNELQNLSLSGNNLSISNGNTINLPLSSLWKSGTGNDIYYEGGNVTVGAATGDHLLSVKSNNTTTNGTNGVFMDVQNTNSSSGVMSGIRFRNGGFLSNTFKAGLYFRRGASNGRGDLLFLNDNALDYGNAVADDARLVIEHDGDVLLKNKFSSENGLEIYNNAGTGAGKTNILLSGDQFGATGHRLENDGTSFNLTSTILGNETNRLNINSTGVWNINEGAFILNPSINGDSRFTTDELEIRGGSDLAENFNIVEEEIDPLPGMLVSIDPDHPGQLKITDSPYCSLIAGVISGANGIDAGMLMGQKGSVADGEYPIALVGRVYAKANLEGGKICPGDLLTSSSVKGEVMKANPRLLQAGSSLGKALMPIDDKGYVLTLINLQ